MGTLRDRIKRLREDFILMPRVDSLIALTNDLRRIVLGNNPHKVDDTTLETNADGTTLATVQTLINSLKAKYNTHRVSTTFHLAADATNTLATADMSDLGTGNTLMIAAKTAFNAHLVLLTSHSIKQDGATLLAANPTDLPTLIVSVNEWKAKYNLHMSFTNIIAAVPTLDVP